MSDGVMTLPETRTTEGFASWLGVELEPEETVTSGLEDAAATPEPAEAVAPDEGDETGEDTPAAEGEAETDAEAKGEDDAETAAPPITLPFEAIANDDAVDPALLAAMTVKFKADGKEVALPLADVVRRAQSEPAAQRQVRVLAQERDEVASLKTQLEQEVAAVRDVAQRMARDPNFYAEVVQQLEEYDSPGARAERAERALAAERQRAEESRRQQQVQSQVQSFAAEVVAPTLDAIKANAPLVSDEEILGKFMADTAAITRNGVIPPEHHRELAEYLRNDLAAFAAERQQLYAARDAQAKAEARKTQMERQKLKNQTAGAAKPTALTGAPSNAPTAPKKPKTLKDAERGALSVLIGS